MYDLPEAQMTLNRGAAVLGWYDQHRRQLPWRADTGEKADPYAVWLSEIMLQQTTVAAVKPYFAAFLSRWPDVEALAKAPLEEVMRQWAGLGYYSRARNLHACAKIVAERFGGGFPPTESALLQLPGIGPYTAAAIAAIAFDQRAVVVDGNVERVVARLFAIETPLPAARAEIRKRAAEITPHARPGDFAQAMMDLGAMICAPKRPACGLCPFADGCAAQASGEPALFPRKAAKRERRRRRGAVFFIRREDGAVLVRSRPQKGLLGGMAEIPGAGFDTHYEAGSAQTLAPIAARFEKIEATVAHVFTHFSLELEIYIASAALNEAAPENCRWIGEQDLDRQAFPSLMRKVIAAVRNSGEWDRLQRTRPKRAG